MPLTRLIRPCHPKNLSVNHLYPIELTRIRGTSADQTRVTRFSLQQLRAKPVANLCIPLFYVLEHKDCSWRGSNPRPLNCFRLPHLRASSLALYQLSYRSLYSVRDSNPRSVMVCNMNILSISWWPSPRDTLNLDTSQNLRT